MDIMELSRKMEGDLLESNTSRFSLSQLNQSFSNHNFSPRLTRSQTNVKKIPMVTEATEPRIKRSNGKVDEIESIYLNKKTKVVHKKLETIYEDPIWRRGTTVLLGTSKIKRSLYLDREFRITTKQKSKLRKTKVKRLGRKKFYKMTDDEFKSRMMRIENYINGNDVTVNYENEDCSTFEEDTKSDMTSSSSEEINGNEDIRIADNCAMVD